MADKSENKNKRGGVVGKLLVAAMAGALAGGTMVGCAKDEAKTEKPAETKKADEQGAAKATPDDKKEGEAQAAATDEKKDDEAKADGEEKKEGKACSGAGGCG